MKNSYFQYSRAWFDFCFANPDKIKPVHTAVFMFILEHNNRLAWRETFGLPTMMVCEAIGIRSINTYKPVLEDLVKFGFLKIIEKSRNQYSSNIVAISIPDIANDKALDIAIAKASDKATDIAPDEAPVKALEKHSHYNKTIVTKEKSDSTHEIPTLEQCRQVAEMSGHHPDYGQRYFEMRDADGWTKPRGTSGNLYPIVNWRNDYANCYNRGYLDKKQNSPENEYKVVDGGVFT